MPHPVIHKERAESPEKLQEILKQAKEICPIQDPCVYEEENGKIVVKHPDKCIGCRACETVCKNNEIEIVD